jgi:hypothetical protein
MRTKKGLCKCETVKHSTILNFVVRTLFYFFINQTNMQSSEMNIFLTCLVSNFFYQGK